MQLAFQMLMLPSGPDSHWRKLSNSFFLPYCTRVTYKHLQDYSNSACSERKDNIKNFLNLKIYLELRLSSPLMIQSTKSSLASIDKQILQVFRETGLPTGSYNLEVCTIKVKQCAQCACVEHPPESILCAFVRSLKQVYRMRSKDDSGNCRNALM